MRREGWRICHEQTQTYREFCFKTLDAELLKDLFSEHLEITTAVIVPYGGPIELLVLHFLNL